MPNADGQRRDFEDFQDLLKIQDVKNLQDQLDGKAVVGHTHTIPDVAGLSLALGSKADAIHSHDFTELNDAPADYTGAALQIVRVNAAETALEFVDPANVLAPGSIEVGDPVYKLRRKPAPSPGPGQWFPAWIDDDVDLAHWLLLQPFLYACKLEVIDTLTDQFLVVNVSRSANVATLEFANTDECALVCQLLYDDLLFDCYDPVINASTPNPSAYSAWAMTVDLPQIDFIPAGRYQLLSVDPATRKITIALNGADQAVTPVTEYAEFFPYRKTGTNTVCRWRKVTDAGLIMGRIPGVRSRDAIGEHTHQQTLFGIVAFAVPGATFGIPAQVGAQATGGASGRTDTINRTRSLGGLLYLFGGPYA